MGSLKPINSSSFPWTIVMFVLALLSLSLPTIGFAVPHHYGRDTGVSGPALQALFPPNLELTLPSTNANFLAVGAGIQNYTCTSAGTYSSIGALANLYDISQLFNANPGEFTNAPNSAMDIWSGDQGETNPFNSQLDNLISSNFGFTKLGTHQFVVFNDAAVPQFDFTLSQANPNAFVIAIKVTDIPSPFDPSNRIDWLGLSGQSGGLASQVFRVNTFQGKPPSSCQPGSGDISVKYSAAYYFF